MQHLRIVGIDEDPENYRLILSDDAGEEFALPVDQALRTAISRPNPRSARAEATTRAAREGGRSLSPREIQAQLRAGATVSDVVAASGHDAAYVEKYAGPVQAERFYMAQRARSTEIASASSAEAHRLAFGDRPASLEAMALARMRSLGIDPGTAEWDAWRTPSGLWQVACWFDMPGEDPGEAAQELPAQWSFAVESRHLDPLNEWAQSLSSLSTADPRRSPSRLEAVDAPFDVEEPASRTRYTRGPQTLVTPLPSPSGHHPEEPEGTQKPSARQRAPEAGPADRTPAGSASSAEFGAETQRGRTAPESPEGGEHENLLDMLRARRGQRLGADAEADDRLALMLTRDETPHTPPRLRALDAGEAPEGQHPEDESPEEGHPAAASSGAQDADLEESARDVGTTPAGESSSAGASGRTGEDAASDDASSGASSPARDSDPDPADTRAAGGPRSSKEDPAWPGDEESRDAWGFSYAESTEEIDRSAVARASAASGNPSAEPSSATPSSADFGATGRDSDSDSAVDSRGTGSHDGAAYTAAAHGAEPDDDDRHSPDADERQDREQSSRRGTRGQGNDPSGSSAEEPPRKRGQGRRPSMPKWDDILFGSKDD